MRFSDDKWKFLHLTWNNPMHQSRLGTHWIKQKLCRKSLGILVDSRLNMSQLLALQ